VLCLTQYWREKRQAKERWSIMHAKGILFYNYSDAQMGFSETYYMEFPTIADCMGNLDVINTSRLTTLCPNVYCAGGVVSDVDIKGDSLLIPPTDRVGSFGETGDVSVADDIGLLTRVEASSLFRGMKCWHGVPNSAYNHGLLDLVLANPYMTAMLAHFGLLITNTQLRVKAPGEPITYEYLAISAIVVRRAGFRNLGRPFGLLHGHRMIA